MRLSSLTTAFLCALYALSVSGCKSKPPKPPPPAVVNVSLQAKPDVNPDTGGRPSPIVLRLYQLKADAAFLGADYFPLLSDEKKVLGPDLVSLEEKELFPGQTLALEVPFSADTRFIAVAGGYHDPGSTVWRAIAPAPGSKGKSVKATAVAERTKVTVSVTP
ncbi:MAG TPA: type VI secretion system lipoprotein TssJ [Steroidobacteraceae bacterium]|jgi:type VI secretion system protein VasD|nr:type VI secretion system lipoprotein TssJ [Steroidobacteraceae bacterium]